MADFDKPGDFCLKELTIRAVTDANNKGAICSVRVDLTNGESSGDMGLNQGSTTVERVKMPRDPKVIRTLLAYYDNNGVYNLHMQA